MPRRKGGTPPASRTAEGLCPLCGQALPRIAGAARYARACAGCGARPQPGRRCARCAVEAVWEAGSRAACTACGHHGSRIRVIAGAHED